MAVCSCNVTLSNSGVPGCQPLPSVAERLILVPIRDGANVRNGIDLTSIPDNAGILALINQADDLKRYYPLPEMENVTNERADPITEEAPSGTVAKIRNGVKTFNGEIWFQGATFAGLVDAFGCATIGAYVVDANGNLIGDRSVSGYLYPLEIKMPTWDVRTLDTSDTTVAKVSLSFQWADKISDQDVGMLVASDFASDVDWLSYNGLIDLYGGTPTSISTTGFTIPVKTAYGSVANPVVQSGLASVDFEIYNVTTASVVVISTMTESPSGTYAFTYTAQTSADVLSLRIASGTNGFDDTNLRAVVITIP